MNAAFIQCGDVDRVERELSRLVVEKGRRLVTPRQRKTDHREPMQIGKGDEVRRWGIAGFRGAPGWTAIRTAPFGLLM